MYNTLRNALPIVAAALGRKLGVEVGVGGHDACTDGRRIQIPDVADDPASRDLAWGYLAHEAGHVRYTDFAVYEQAAREGPLQETLQNRIEDVRIERELARPYPGTRMSIATVMGRMLAEGRMSAPAPGDHPAQVLAAYLLLALRHEVLGQDVLAAEARKATNTLQQVFPAPFIARLRTLMGEVPGLTSTAEAVDLARRVRRLIEEVAEGVAKAASPSPGQQQVNKSDDAPEPQPGEGEAGSHRRSETQDDESRESQSPAGADGPDDGDSTGQGSSVDNERDATGRRQPANDRQCGADNETDEMASSPSREDCGGQDGSASAQNADAGKGQDPDVGRTGTKDKQKSSPITDATDKDEDSRGDCAAGANGTDGAGQRDALAAVLTASAGDCDGDLFTEVGKLLGTEASPSNEIRLPLPEDYAGNALAGMRLLARVQAESARLSARLQGLVQASRMDRPRPVRQRSAVGCEAAPSRGGGRCAHLRPQGPPHRPQHGGPPAGGSVRVDARACLSQRRHANHARRERPGVGAGPRVGARRDTRRDSRRHRVSRVNGSAGSGDEDDPARPVTTGVRWRLHPGSARRDADGAGPVVCRGGPSRLP